MTTDISTDYLHEFARQRASEMPGINMKLVRWNDIVSVALKFYPTNPKAGVVECLQSCRPGDPMYDGKNTLAKSLEDNYQWMIE